MADHAEEKVAPTLDGHHKRERVKKYLFKRPLPLNTWEKQEHRSESWMELFIDLFYVAFFLKLGDIMHTCGTSADIITYVASVFLGVYMAKFDFDQYMNKFVSEDLVHRAFFCVYSVGLVVMILDVNESSAYGDNDESGSYHDDAPYDDDHRRLAGGPVGDLPLHCPEVYSYLAGFTVGWLITRMSILVMYCIIYIYVKPQGPYVFASKAPILLTSMAIMCSNYFVPTSDLYTHTYIIMAASLVEFLGWAVWEVLVFGSWIIKNVGRSALIPTNVHHHASRTGTFVMLVLGEAVIAILTPTLLNSGRIYAFTLLGSLLIFFLAVLYFDVQPQQHAAHALGISRSKGMLWICLHPFLSFTLFGVGVSIKLIYEDLRLHEHDDQNQVMLSIFLGLSIFLMTLIRGSHKTHFTDGGIFTLCLRCTIASLHIIFGVAFSGSVRFYSDETTLSIHLFLVFITLIVDTLKYRHLETRPATTPRMSVPAIRSSLPTRKPTSTASTNNLYGSRRSLQGSAQGAAEIVDRVPLRRASSGTDSPTTMAMKTIIDSKPGAKIRQIRRRNSLNELDVIRSAEDMESKDGTKSPFGLNRSPVAPRPMSSQRGVGYHSRSKSDRVISSARKGSGRRPGGHGLDRSPHSQSPSQRWPMWSRLLPSISSNSIDADDLGTPPSEGPKKRRSTSTGDTALYENKSISMSELSADKNTLDKKLSPPLQNSDTPTPEEAQEKEMDEPGLSMSELSISRPPEGVQAVMLGDDERTERQSEHMVPVPEDEVLNGDEIIQEGAYQSLPPEEFEDALMYEIDENNQLVEVQHTGTDEDDYYYDEQYIEVVYEDEGDDDYSEDEEVEIVIEEEPEEIASHITWL